MLRSQPASSSSARGGKRSRLGSRGRQKHKRLDSICDNALNRDNEIEIKNIEGKNEAEPMENGSDLRRSTRVRRAPAVLDVSPPPPKRRRKNGRGRGKFHAGLASPSETVDSSKRGFSAARSSEGDSDDDSGDWKSRLRTRVSSSRQVKARDSPHGKRSLFKHLDEVSSSRQVKARDAPHGKRRLFKDLDEVEQAEEVISLSEDDSMDEEEDGRKSRMVKSTRPGTVRAELSCSAESHGELEDEQRKPEMDTALDGSDVDEKLHAQVENNSPEAESDAPVHKGDTDETSLLSGMNEASMVKLSEAVREKEVCPGSQLEGKHICNSVEPTDAHDSVMEVPDLGDDVHKETSPKRNDTSVVNASKQCEAQVSDGMSKLIDPIEDVKTDETDPRHVPVAVAKESDVPSIPQEKPLKDKAASEKDMSRISNIRYRPKCIIEGRRCGLCGGGTDGKPPKILIHDTAGNEHEPYSGSSGPEEPDYDVCDGFSEEPGWLGRLLGPINDRHGIAGIWVHQQCAVWSPEVYFAGVGCLKNVRAAIFRGKALKCTRCGRPGATTGCRIDRCPRTYHLPCARASRCIFDHRKFLIACTDHRRLFQPQGYNYIKLVKKLKAKKMKLEIRKQSVDACRKDLEAEEKWLEKCGEDEEFLKRESKRLQRDMARVAPVYIGGSHSEGEKLFEDWESVAGLQDVIRCMKEVVILPLLYPEFFDNMGLTPPRGILLHGYPGTGKTLVVRALIGSCARGDKRIAYFARKGADCLGKYVGDAERQLRLLFQVAEKSQPSIIFFDEIDGLAPVRSRQQDQTHSSVVSTLLALMDGLKNRGSVIVIGATNRPDAVDPALRRPGRFDREIYFPLPSVKDRAAIVALHTRRWPKPLDSSLLDWIARRTVGFAGADLQALCTHAAVTAVKRRCPLHKILSDTGKSELTGKQPHLPSFVVDKQDWLEALSSVPPPCSRREAGNAAHEVSGNPLSLQLVPCLLQPLSSLIVSLYLDERIWLPSPLYSAGKSIQRTIISSLQENLHHADKWWSHVHQLLLKSDVSNKIVTDLSLFGIVAGDTISETCDISYDIFDDNKRRIGPWHHDSNLFGVPANRSIYGKRAGYRMLIAGNPKSGQKHLASCFIQCFVGNIEIQKIDMATMSHEGQGDMIQGMANVLFKCASLKSCAVYLPRIDLWALEESAPLLVSQTSDEDGSDHADGVEDCSNCGVPHSSGESENQEENCASGSWKSFTEQFGSICVSTSLIVLATSEVPYEELPLGVRQFFGSSDPLLCKGSTFSEHTVPRITVELNGEFDRDKMAYSSASKLSWDLIRQFIQLRHHRIHPVQESRILGQIEDDSSMPKHNNLDHMSTEEPKSGVRGPEDGVRTTVAPCTNRIMKGRSNLMMAITSFGYQILTYPHFAELCWVTSKLKEGPYANVIGPWKGWPFNSCIVRPTSAPEKKDVVPSSNKDKQQFSSVRGLIAVGLSAYRGLYTSLSHVSLEIRKVLELLVGEINARIQSGKEGYQFVSLLSQVAYLEDMVNNWVYSLRSLEIDAQILLANQSLNPPSSPVEDIPKPVTTERSMGNDSVECGLVHNEIQNTGIRSMKETTNTREHSPTEMSVNPDKESCQILASEAPNFQEESSRGGSEEGDALCSIDVENLVADPSCLRTSDGVAHEVFLSENHEYVQVRVNNGFVETGPSHLSGREFLGTDTDHLKHAENGAHVDDAKPNCEMDVESTKPSEDPQLVCSYRCCLGCMRALLELVQKAVDMEWEPYGDSLTVEDAYDLVGSLSSRLGSMTQKLYVDESLIGSVRSKGGSSDKRNSLPDSAGMKVDVCKCSTWESDSFIPRKCTCHSGSSSESNSLVSREVKFSSIFVYKDGVLVSSDSEKDALFHCTYEDLCLCSLVELLALSARVP